jgi:hypothetical protein
MPVVAFRAYRTRKKFIRHAAVIEEMARVHDDVLKPAFIKDFQNIVANWSTRPGFTGRKYLEPDGFRIAVYPTGSAEAKQLWEWNVVGTAPHRIAARRAPRLRFLWGGPGSYLAKTGPGGKWYGGAGRVVGGTWHMPFEVQHPGTAPRNWYEVIKEKRKDWYTRQVENAWRRGLRKMDAG